MVAQFREEGRDKYGFVSPDGVLLGAKCKGIVACPGRSSPPSLNLGRSALAHSFVRLRCTRADRNVTGTSPNYPRPPPGPPGPPEPPGPAPSNSDCTAAAAASLAAGDAVTVGPRDGNCEEFTLTSTAHALAVLSVRGHTLCIVPNASAGSVLVLGGCPGTAGGVSTAAAAFTLNHNNTAPQHAAKQQIVHTATNACLTGSAGVAMLAPCQPNDDAQLWVFGSSGRFAGTGGHLGVAGH